MKGVPKRDGSGRGTRANQGRGGCSPPKNRGRVGSRGRGISQPISRRSRNR